MQLSFAHILSGLICKQVCFLLRCWCASIHPRLTNDAERMKKKAIFDAKSFYSNLSSALT